LFKIRLYSQRFKSNNCVYLERSKNGNLMSPPKYRNDFVFNDFDEYAKLIQQGDLEYSKLSSGRFLGSLNQLIYGPVMISHHQMNQKILQRGSGLNGYTTFLIPGNMEQDFIWRKNNLKGNVIGILQGRMEHDCMTPENFVGIPVSIENNYLSECSHNLGCSEIIDQLEFKEVITISENKAKRLHRLLLNCFHIDQEFLEVQLDRLMVLLITSLDEAVNKNESKKLQKTNRINIYSRARDYIHDHIEGNIAIADLCNSIGSSQRNLRYVFEYTAGLSPKKYINHCRLNKVRSDLKSGYFEKIIEVAHINGFWHSGQFAADYLKLFGELPSETFKKT